MNRYFGLHTLEGEWHALLPRYILLAERLEGRRVLDIGCGSGIGASVLRELGAEMVDAIDHRPGVLEVARMKHTKDGLDFHVMFWEELDFPEDTFDVVVCLDPSSPVTDPSLIQEVRRVLKPGGEYICAIERKTLGGIETLLPRYGYVDAAESIDINDAQERVPQLGELHKHFDTVSSIVQRPLLAYVFDREDLGKTTRKEGKEGGVWVEEDSSKNEEGGRWLSVDNRLSANEDDPGSVEIWFCGDDEIAAPPLKEVRLPYYGISERLHQVVGDLQVRGVSGVGDEDSLFEEVLDQPATDEIEQRYDVSTFGAENEWEAQPTTIHKSSLPPQGLEEQTTQRDSGVSQFQEELSELRSLYGHMHNDFQRMLAQAQGALAERDGYIQHLVEQVQHWQGRYLDGPPTQPLRDDSVTTGVYQKLDSPAGPQDAVGQLEAKVARLRDEQRRLAIELEEKNAFLRPADDESDTSERAPLSRHDSELDEETPGDEDEGAGSDSEDAVADDERAEPSIDDAPLEDGDDSGADDDSSDSDESDPDEAEDEDATSVGKETDGDRKEDED